MQLRLLSFNIRCNNDPDGHSIPERAPRVAAILRKYAPDIIGMQEYHRRWEPSWSVLDDAAYEEMIVDRGDGEGNVLRWRRDRFEAVDKGHFWFADDPNTPSTDWDEKYHKARICIYCVLKERQSGKIFTYMNVHYGFGDEGQKKNAQLLRAYAQKLGNHPTVIAGDFNLKPGTPGYLAMTDYYTDANTEGLADPTYHNYARTPGCILDYCFLNQGVKPLTYEPVTDTFEGKYPSDHYGICIGVEVL